MKMIVLLFLLALAPLIGYFLFAGVAAKKGWTVEGVKRAFWQSGAVVTVKSVYVTNRDALPSVITNRPLIRAPLQHARGIVSIANGDSVGSIYKVTEIPANAIPVSVRISAPDIGTTTTADVGLYQNTVNGGAVLDADFFKAAVVLNAGAITKTELVNGNANCYGLNTVDNWEKRIWEVGPNGVALTVDPQRTYDVCLTLTGAADAAGKVVVEIDYVI